MVGDRLDAKGWAMMTLSVPSTLALAAALGSGLMAGLYFAFSICVMEALGRVRPAQGIAVMQAINVSILNVTFASVFGGTALVALGSAVMAVIEVGWVGSGYSILGAAAYLIGSLGLTLAYHVPRNEALARLDPEAPDAVSCWARYRSEWTSGNHARVLASLLATVAFVLAAG